MSKGKCQHISRLGYTHISVKAENKLAFSVTVNVIFFHSHVLGHVIGLSLKETIRFMTETKYCEYGSVKPPVTMRTYFEYREIYIFL